MQFSYIHHSLASWLSPLCARNFCPHTCAQWGRPGTEAIYIYIYIYVLVIHVVWKEVLGLVEGLR